MSRTHHYLFAHRVLPSMFYDNPAAFIAGSLEDGAELARRVWDRVGQDFLEDEEEVIASDGLDVLPVKSPPYLGAVYVLPDPVEPVEAYMVCAIGKVKKPFFGDPTLKKPRFFTLELGDDLEGNSYCVLCEWAKDGSHLNLGAGPEPEPNAFISCCLKLL